LFVPCPNRSLPPDPPKDGPNKIPTPLLFGNEGKNAQFFWLLPEKGPKKSVPPLVQGGPLFGGGVTTSVCVPACVRVGDSHMLGDDHVLGI